MDNPLRLDQAEGDVLQIVDAFSWFRVRLETEPGGMALRNALTDVRFAPSVPFIVFDGPGGNDRRKQKYAGYKGNRKPARDDIYASIRLFRELLAFVPCVTICCPGWEADDVIATLVRSSTQPKVRIVTKDKDLSQLVVDRPGVSCTAGFPASIVPCEEVRLYKTLVGDPSDNIPGLLRFGEKAWLELNKPALMRAFRTRTCPEEGLDPKVLGLTSSLYTRLMADWEQLLVFWDIVGLLDVPVLEIKKNIRTGKNDWPTVDRILREYMQ